MRSCIPILILLLCGTAVRSEDVTFFIEAVEVRGTVHASAELIANETLVQEGTTYTEQQLRDAFHRVKRLPFVFDAEMSLERGSTRGAYLLVIDVAETRPWFFGFLADPRDADRKDGIIVGRRWFAGTSGVTHVAASLGDTNGVSVGYTRYDLFDRNAVASVNLRIPLSGPSYTDIAQPSPQFLLAVPLSPNQSIRASYDLSLLRVPNPFTEEKRSAQDHLVNLLWQYRTVDDPFFPRDGSDIQGGVRLRSHSGHFRLDHVGPPDGPPILQATPAHARSAGLVVGAAQYADLGRQFTLGLRVTGETRHEWVRVHYEDPFVFDAPRMSGTSELTLSGSFWGEERTRRNGPFRWEVGLAAEVERHSFIRRNEPDATLQQATHTRQLVNVAVGRRHSWGVYRFVLSFPGRWVSEGSIERPPL
jgi:hypothetical protein